MASRISEMMPAPQHAEQLAKKMPGTESREFTAFLDQNIRVPCDDGREGDAKGTDDTMPFLSDADAATGGGPSEDDKSGEVPVADAAIVAFLLVAPSQECITASTSAANADALTPVVPEPGLRGDELKRPLSPGDGELKTNTAKVARDSGNGQAASILGGAPEKSSKTADVVDSGIEPQGKPLPVQVPVGKLVDNQRQSQMNPGQKVVDQFLSGNPSAGAAATLATQSHGKTSEMIGQAPTSEPVPVQARNESPRTPSGISGGTANSPNQTPASSVVLAIEAPESGKDAGGSEPESNPPGALMPELAAEKVRIKAGITNVDASRPQASVLDGMIGQRAGSAPAISANIAGSSLQRFEKVQEFMDNVGRHVLLLAKGNAGQITVNLIPGELGRVVLNCHETANGISVQMHAENPAAYSLLQRQEAAVRAVIEQNGLTMSRFEVGAWNERGREKQGGEWQPGDDGASGPWPEDDEKRGASRGHAVPAGAGAGRDGRFWAVA
ncbi:MAG: flagellar hook-length control protein FliK [bacterium]